MFIYFFSQSLVNRLRWIEALVCQHQNMLGLHTNRRGWSWISKERWPEFLESDTTKSYKITNSAVKWHHFERYFLLETHCFLTLYLFGQAMHMTQSQVQSSARTCRKFAGFQASRLACLDWTGGFILFAHLLENHSILFACPRRIDAWKFKLWWLEVVFCFWMHFFRWSANIMLDIPSIGHQQRIVAPNSYDSRTSFFTLQFQ